MTLKCYTIDIKDKPKIQKGQNIMEEKLNKNYEEIEDIEETEEESRGDYKLTKYEQEVHLNFNMEDDLATLYTSSTTWMKKMDKLVETYPDAYKVVDVSKICGTVIGKTYEFPIEFFRLGKPRKELSEERKEELRNRLASFKK